MTTAGDVDDRDANTFADLRSSETDALRGVHGGEHVFGKFGEFGVEFSDGGSGFFEDGIAVLNDGVDFARSSGNFLSGGGVH